MPGVTCNTDHQIYSLGGGSNWICGLCGDRQTDISEYDRYECLVAVNSDYRPIATRFGGHILIVKDNAWYCHLCSTAVEYIGDAKKYKCVEQPKANSTIDTTHCHGHELILKADKTWECKTCHNNPPHIEWFTLNPCKVV